MLKIAAKNEQKATLHISCGTEDHLFGFNKTLYEMAVELGFNATWLPKEGMGHSWPYGVTVTPEILKRFPLKELNEREE